MHVITVTPRNLFQALADPIRIRIVRLLATTGEESCLCELVDSLLEPQYKLSKHVKILRQAGLLTAEREGRFVYHRLVKKMAHLRPLYATIRALPDTEGIFARDLERFLERMNLRDDGRCRMGIRMPSLAAGS